MLNRANKQFLKSSRAAARAEDIIKPLTSQQLGKRGQAMSRRRTAERIAASKRTETEPTAVFGIPPKTYSRAADHPIFSANCLNHHFRPAQIPASLGHPLQQRHYNGTNQAVKMALDSNGNIYVTGFSQNTNTNLGYVTIKYAPNGNQLLGCKTRFQQLFHCNAIRTSIGQQQ